jgi:hypothetical protein
MQSVEGHGVDVAYPMRELFAESVLGPRNVRLRRAVWGSGRVFRGMGIYPWILWSLLVGWADLSACLAESVSTSY